MPTRLSDLLRYIDAEARQLRSAYEAVPVARRHVRPAPDRWSAAEVVHHVTIVERRLVERLRGLIEEAKKLGDAGDPRMRDDLQARATDRSKRFKTGEASEPKDTDVTRVWIDFDETRSALRAVIESAEGVALHAVSAPHPALGDFNGYDWIVFAGAHTRRHADQIREDNHALYR